MTPQTMKKKLTLPKLGTVSDYRHFWMLSFWILYLILYVVVEHAVTTDYWVSYLPLDDKIPFCEYFIVPYCMWHPLLFLMTVYLAFYDVETFRKYMWFVLAGLVSAIVVCWIFPNGAGSPPRRVPAPQRLYLDGQPHLCRRHEYQRLPEHARHRLRGPRRGLL